MDRFAKYIAAWHGTFLLSAFVIGGLFALGCSQ